MLKAEIGDFLYIIIFAVLMLLGGLEKVMKAKKQQNMPPPRPPQPYDDFEDVEDLQTPRQSPPQTLEDLMRRMMHPMDTEEAQSLEHFPEEAQSLEDLPATPHFHYQPLVCPTSDKEEREAFATDITEDEIKASENRNFEFDIRQAVIASEILNRKY